MQYGLQSRAIDEARHEVSLRGRVYAGASDELRHVLDGATATARWLVVDATELQSIDAVALQGLLTVVRRLRTRDGGVGFFGLAPDVLRFFELTGFDRVVSVSPSRDEALRKAA